MASEGRQRRVCVPSADIASRTPRSSSTSRTLERYDSETGECVIRATCQSALTIESARLAPAGAKLIALRCKLGAVLIGAHDAALDLQRKTNGLAQ